MTRRIAMPGLVLMAVAVAMMVLPTGLLAADDIEGPPEQQPLAQLLFNVRHHIIMGEFDLAVSYIKVVLNKKPPAEDLIRTIEDDPQNILNRADDGIYALLEKCMKRSDKPELAKAARDLDAYIQACIVELKTKAPTIEREINKLDPKEGLRKLDLGLTRLKWMSPYSVPLMVIAMMDDQRAALRPNLIKALPDMGRSAVEPLCEALDMQGNVAYKIILVGVLAKIGYSHSIPYIQRLAETEKSQQMQLACQEAIKVLQRSPRATYAGAAGKMFYQLAEGFYTDQPSLRSPVAAPLVPLWDYKAAQGGVVYANVPRGVYPFVMTMRSLDRSLALDKNQPDAVALWLCANFRKEAAGGGPEAGVPPASYFAMLAGPDVLLRALSRAIKDSNSTVALGVVRALNEVGLGKGGLLAAGALQPAMLFPDIRVAIEAAWCYKPYQPTRLPGTDVAVRVLAASLSQTGEKFAVALLPKGADASKGLMEQLKAAGYHVVLATKRQGALDAARAERAPRLDLAVIDYNAQEGGLPGLAELRTDYRFAHTPTLVVATAIEPAKEDVKDLPLVGVIGETAQAPEIADTVAGLLAGAGMVPLTVDDAKTYAVRSAEVLRLLALEPATANDAQEAAGSLMLALGDPRQEVAAAAGQALGCIGIETCQRALAQASLDAKADSGKRIALFNALAASAKRFGNKLLEDQATGLTDVATKDPHGDVRNAAAKAMASMGLTIEGLILNPPKAPAPAAPAPAKP